MTSRFATLSPLRLRLRAPLRTAQGVFREREGLILSVKTEGLTALGEAMPLPGFGTESLREARLALEDWVSEARDFMMPRSLQEVVALLRGAASLSGRPAAQHAVESVLLDLLAQRQGMPVARLLDPAATSSIAVNALLSELEPQLLAAQGRVALAQGFRTLKVKVGQGPIRDDVARLSALREAVGTEVAIRIDANGSWGISARAHLQSLAAVGLELCEQPVAAGDLSGLRMLRGSVPCRIAADESIGCLADGLNLIEPPSPVVDLLALRPMVLGGVLPALALARSAARAGVGAFVVSSLDGIVARSAGIHLAAALPGGSLAHGLGVGGLFENGPSEGPFQVVEGSISVPNVPGLGFQRSSPWI